VKGDDGVEYSMQYYERFQILLNERGTKIADLSKATGIPKTTLYGIIRKKAKNISLVYASKIADYFNVSVEYLATGKEIPKPLKLAEDEIGLVDLWRQLPHDEQMQMIGRIKQLLEQGVANKGEKIG
jgi:transcriptional regulator with XRE-family HTH domain